GPSYPAGDPARISAQSYTQQMIVAAQASETIADQLEKKWGNTDPAEDQIGWTALVTRRRVADQDWAKAEQAIAAELRLVRGNDPRNTAAVENAAHEIANRYRDNPDTQARVTAALQTVLTESPMERATNIKLNDVNQAAARLDELLAIRDAGQPVSAAELTAARTNYDNKRKDLLAAVAVELDARYQSMSGVPLNDTLALAANGMNRYADDPELTAVLKAAVILRRVIDAGGQGTEAQMNLLGTELPRGVDPNVKGLVMSDARIIALSDKYTTEAAASVADAYKTRGTLAGAEALRDATNPSLHPAMSPQLAAQIINKSLPTVGQIVGDINNKEPKGGGGYANGQPVQIEGPKVVLALAQSVEVAAAGSDWQQHTYDSPEISTAVRSVARLIATHPQRDLIIWGPQEAVKNGYATLALQVAVELGQITEGDVQRPPGGGNGRTFDDFNRQREYWRDNTLEAINTGLQQLQQTVDTTLETAAEGMAPLLAQGKYADALTDEAFNSGIQSLTASDTELQKKVKAGREAIDALGYRLLRTSESVEFYRTQLGGVGGYGKLDQTRNELMKNERSTTVILASDAATFRAGTQIVRGMAADELRNGGALNQTYGVGAQTVGDLSEFLAETYLIKNLNVQAGALPKPSAVNVPGVDIDVSRAAHLPFFGGVAIWGAGGGLQAVLTGYLFDNVHIDSPTGDLRKALLLGLVGGFAGFHLMQAGMALVRIGQHSFAPGGGSNAAVDWLDGKISEWSRKISGLAGKDASWGLYVREGTARENWTRLSVEATPGLIRQLVGLMTLATLWDASGLFESATGLQKYSDTATRFEKSVAHGVNLFSDTILLRLQLREMALRYLGKQVMADPELRALAAQRAAAEGIRFDLRTAGVYALGEPGRPPAFATGRNWWASSSFLNKFEAAFTDVKWAEKLAPSLRAALFREVAGKGSTQWAVRVLGSNPIGWIVNIAYLATTVVNWWWDHNKAIDTFERYDRAFLSGVGIDAAHVEVMKQHHWWSGDGKVNGFLKMYVELGGHPAEFLAYVASMSPQQLDKLMQGLDAASAAPEELPETSATDYWLLPVDPTDARQRQYNGNLKFNAEKQRWEDIQLGMYFVEDGRWQSIDVAVPGHYVAYDASTHKLTRPYYEGDVDPQHPMYGRPYNDTTVIAPASSNGLRTWMTSTGQAFPPTQSHALPPQPELPPLPPEVRQNVYVVQPGDSIWKLADNDPQVVAEIYRLNPWLNDRLEYSRAAEGAGRNPNIINPGEKLILPEGYETTAG
ncbi:MAG TPA: hypothetical protein VIT67_15420, partial [Povalibacter sp.]